MHGAFYNWSNLIYNVSQGLQTVYNEAQLRSEYYVQIHNPLL